MNLKEHIKQLIREELNKEDVSKGKIGLTLLKFPQLKEALTNLLSKSFLYFIKEIKIIAPKPTTFEVKLINNLDFSLQYVFKAKNFITKISGKKYNLSILSDNQRAIQSIANLLALSPAEQPTISEQGQNPNDGYDAGANAFNDTFSGGGFEEPTAPSSEIPPGVEPTPLDGGAPEGNEPEDINIKEIKRININEFKKKIGF